MVLGVTMSIYEIGGPRESGPLGLTLYILDLLPNYF